MWMATKLKKKKTNQNQKITLNQPKPNFSSPEQWNSYRNILRHTCQVQGGDVFSIELSERTLREAARSQQNQLPGM